MRLGIHLGVLVIMRILLAVLDVFIKCAYLLKLAHFAAGCCSCGRGSRSSRWLWHQLGGSQDVPPA